MDMFESIVGDATDLSKWADKSVDLCFSNSVIEHVGNKQKKKKMAEEMMRVGKHVYLQTPSFFFPFEPHFKAPFFHWFPRPVQIILLKHFNMGYFKKCKKNEEAEDLLCHNDLLKYRDLQTLFPKAVIHKEKFLFFTKSYYFFI